jgi:hypothetical protein
MRTTLKRVDIGSAFRVGVVVYAVLFAVFGLLFVALQGWFISSIARFADDPDLFAGIVGGGILSLLCFYAVGIVAAAIFGGIQFALGAFCYNLAANWVGGIRIELERDDEDVER